MTTHGLSMFFNLNLSFKQIRKKHEIREVNKSIEKFKTKERLNSTNKLKLITITFNVLIVFKITL